MSGPLSAFVAAVIIGLAIQPPLRRLCAALGQVDKPDNNRKRQASPIPLSGGIATAIACVAATALSYMLTDALTVTPELFVFAGGAAIALIMGIIDDRRALCAWQKLVAQFLAAGCACYAGFTIDQISLPFVERPIPMHHAVYPVTVLCFAACMNGFNFIDGSDGVAPGVGIVICGGIMTIACLNHAFAIAAIAAALAGALLSFLHHNWPPARAYLGDAGSMFIGYLLAALALAAPHGANGLAILPALMLVAYPLYEVASTPIRRWRRRLPLGDAELGHPHFALQSRGHSPSRTALIISGANLVIVTLAVLAARSSPAVVLGIALAVLAALAWLTIRLGILAKTPKAS